MAFGDEQAENKKIVSARNPSRRIPIESRIHPVRPNERRRRSAIVRASRVVEGGRSARLAPSSPLRYLGAMELRGSIRRSAWMVVSAQVAYLLSTPAVLAEAEKFKGDVSEVRVIRRVTQHPYAWRVWQPFII